MHPFLLTHYWAFAASTDIAKGRPVSPAHYIGFALLTTAPIHLKAKDILTIDVRTGKVEIIERAGITIYRDAWRN